MKREIRLDLVNFLPLHDNISLSFEERKYLDDAKQRH